MWSVSHDQAMAAAAPVNPAGATRVPICRASTEAVAGAEPWDGRGSGAEPPASPGSATRRLGTARLAPRVRRSTRPAGCRRPASGSSPRPWPRPWPRSRSQSAGRLRIARPAARPAARRPSTAGRSPRRRRRRRVPTPAARYGRPPPAAYPSLAPRSGAEIFVTPHQVRRDPECGHLPAADFHEPLRPAPPSGSCLGEVLPSGLAERPQGAVTPSTQRPLVEAELRGQLLPPAGAVTDPLLQDQQDPQIDIGKPARW